MSDAEHLLRRAYDAFNERDIERALATLHARVNWPNAWEGGRVIGRAAVRDYWERQFAQLASDVDPLRFVADGDGGVTVEVRQIVRDARTHELVSDSTVRHRYQFEDGLILRMDVLEDDEPDVESAEPRG